MPLRPTFFDVPMIRATPASALNDPFEGRFNNDQVRNADKWQSEYYKANDKDVYTNDDSIINDIAGNIQENLSELGIISFTEDYNNPLMWAHYADDHRGFVVEFDFTQPFFADSIKNINGRLSRFEKDHFGEVFEFPEKVDYRREMPDFSRSELSAPDTINEFHWKKFNRAILFTKSNDWIYEKEQRSIVRLKDADSIICNNDEHVRRVCNENSSIQLIELGKEKIQVVFPPEYEMHEDMGDTSIKDEIFRLTSNRNDPAVHLFRINPNAITGVYFGCNSHYHESLIKIKQNNSLTRLSQRFIMKPNSHLYQLDKINL